MRKRIATICTVSALAGVGAAQVLVWLNMGIVHLLVMSPAAWEVEDAAHASPWILASFVGAAGMHAAGWFRYDEDEDWEK